MKTRFLPFLGVVCILASPASRAMAEAESAPDVVALEKSAAEGDAKAKYLLAKAYFKATGVEKDAAKSAQLLQEASALGNSDAMDALGYLYMLGEGVPKDESKAVEWFRKAAEAGSLKGQLNLGLMLRQGKTIKLSNEESLLWIQKSADGGLMEAKGVLGRLYFLGDTLQPRDIGKAVPYLREAAESGNPICQNMLGVAYRDGAGVEKNDAVAEEWFRKAALQNSVKAQSNLAHLLGVESSESPNRKEALKWLIISSEQGEITASKTYGEIMPTLPSSLVVSATKEAKQFLLLQRATVGGKKNLAAPAPEPAEKVQADGGA